MAVNLNKPARWKADIATSVDMYNDWFMTFAPQAFQETRVKTTSEVEMTLQNTANLSDVSAAAIRDHPSILPTLRMTTCPPISRDRLIGLAGVKKSLVGRMEKEGKLPVRMSAGELTTQLDKIGYIIEKMADPDILVWLGRKTPATPEEIHRAATIVADRLCGAQADPIIRNTQEQRQLAAIGGWLSAKGYKKHEYVAGETFEQMPAGTYSFRMNVSVGTADSPINIPVDTVIMRKSAKEGDYPLLIEAKSAGDFTNTNKRRKEEAQKVTQLRAKYGVKIEFILFLCGYFDCGYLGYEAAEGIDWVWEHRMDDMEKFGL